MTLLRTVSAGLLAATLMPAAAMAATVTLDLTTLGTTSLGTGASYSTTLGGSSVVSGNTTTTYSGLDVSLSALSAVNSVVTSNSGGTRHISTWTGSGSGSTSASALNFSLSGAGVWNPKEGLTYQGQFRDGANADTAGGYADLFEIVVPQGATLVSATFTEESYNGGGQGRSSFVWAYDSNNSGAIGTGDAISSAISLGNAGSTTFGVTSDAFLFGASGNNTAFRLASVTFSYAPTVTVTVAPPSPVPLPASGVLLAGMMAGAGFLARRRRP